MRNLDSYVATMKLDLLRASPVESRSFVNVPGLGYYDVRMYRRPADPKKGRKYETTVLIGVYADGSFSAFFESDEAA